MTQATAKPTNNGHSKIDQAARNACAAHDFSGQDKQWHRHKGEDVQLGENTLWQDREKLCFVDSNKG